MIPCYLLVILLLSSEIFGRTVKKQTNNVCKPPAECVTVEKCRQLREGTIENKELSGMTKCGDAKSGNVCCVECGKSRIQTSEKIMGGKTSELGQWPWMVAIGYTENEDFIIFCGASVITNKWLLTAAHCVQEKEDSLNIARIGDLNLKSNVPDNATVQEIPFEKIFRHPNYTKSMHCNDVALIQLKSPIEFTMNVRPVCILHDIKYSNNSAYKEKRGYISGWGSEQFGTVTSDTLMYAEIYTDDYDKCKINYGKREDTSVIIDERIICAAGKGRDSCQHDSGGPFVMSHTGKFHLIGIVSFGFICGEVDYPGVYTKVSYFSKWIMDVIHSKS